MLLLACGSVVTGSTMWLADAWWEMDAFLFVRKEDLLFNWISCVESLGLDWVVQPQVIDDCMYVG